MVPFALAELRSRRRMLAGLGAGGFTLLLIVGLSYHSLGVGAFGDAFRDHQPRAITALSGSRSGNWLAPHGWMAFGFNHPMFLVVTLTVAIAVGSGAIAGEVESGRSELLFTGPVDRSRFLGTMLVVWLVAELAVLAVTLGGAVLGATLSSDLRHAGVAELAWAPLQYLPLALFIAACAFLASALASTRGQAVGGAVAITVLSYLLNVISGLIGALDWLRWLTPFGYYDPTAAITHGLRPAPAAALVLAAAALLATARSIVERRDLA
jgi:ABC-2 type transport system permease protein